VLIRWLSLAEGTEGEHNNKKIGGKRERYKDQRMQEKNDQAFGSRVRLKTERTKCGFVGFWSYGLEKKRRTKKWTKEITG